MSTNPLDAGMLEDTGEETGPFRWDTRTRCLLGCRRCEGTLYSPRASMNIEEYKKSAFNAHGMLEDTECRWELLRAANFG